MRRSLLVLSVLLLVAQPIPVAAQTGTVDQQDPQVTLPLFPAEVLESSATSFPDILESLAREAAARGDQLAAEGAFDLVFNADGFDRVTGFWTGAILNTEVRRNIRPFGAQVFGGYRISDGTFPIYEDINFTNTGGEFKIGALFSLLRDRDIDPRRFRVEDARLASQQASLDVALTQVGVQLQVLSAYWRWFATGQELLIYQDLLEIAQQRADGLEEQVRRGAQPDIAVTENLQNILRREILVAEAERNFAIASNALSFFLRDEFGELVLPEIDRLPAPSQVEGLQDLASIVRADASDILKSRPELRNLRLALQRARNKVELGENDLKPDLDLNFEVSRDVGNIAEGGESRDSTDTIIGFRFSVPLQRRDARGRLQRAEAELRSTQLRERRVRDQISIELDNILANLSASLRLADLAEGEVSQADLMVEAERRRFNLGASDFFLVNVREERAADARIGAIRANLNGRLAEASYNAATMNFAALGL